MTKNPTIQDMEQVRAQAEAEAAAATSRAQAAQARLTAVLAAEEAQRQADLLAWSREVIASYADDRAALFERQADAHAALITAVEAGDLGKALAAFWREEDARAELHAIEKRHYQALNRLPGSERASAPKSREPRDYAPRNFVAVLTGVAGDLAARRYDAISERVNARYHEIMDGE